VVGRLLEAGAALTGIARTDEFAYSLGGTNAHFGTPPNPKAPYRISGGSTSGSASAVSLGHATIGLGTDTGGSIRVPASYQGLCGIRTTHDAVSRQGLLTLAPSFDAVGWLTRTPELLRKVGDVLLPGGTTSAGRRLVGVRALTALAEPDVTAALSAIEVDATEDALLRELPDWRAAFQTWQAWEAWQVRGSWLTGRLDTLGEDVRGRFEQASRVSHDQADSARAIVESAAATLVDLVGDAVLVLPSASSVAPRPGSNLQAVRTATMTLTCIAGLAGLPAVSLPFTTTGGLPVGACLVAAPGRDRDLLDLAVDLTT
jgi:amidase